MATDPFAGYSHLVVLHLEGAKEVVRYAVAQPIAVELEKEYISLDPSAKSYVYRLPHNEGVFTFDMTRLIAMNIHEGNGVRLSELLAQIK